MKRFMLFFGFVALYFLIGTSAIYAQENSESEVISNIRTAIQAGSSKDLISYFNNPIELNLNNKKTSYSKNQVTFVLKDFFDKHQASDFSYIHQGASKEGLKYVIGKYVYAGGEFRVYMLIKEFEGNYLIDTLDFSED